MGDAVNNQKFPRGALVSVAALISFTLIAVAISKLTIDSEQIMDSATAEIIINRDLKFVDREGGKVIVYDANKNKEVAILEPGADNFIRGVLRGLVRERRSHKLGDESAFRLMQLKGGQLVLEDLATNRQINLNAFGKTNAGSFVRLLAANENT